MKSNLGLWLSLMSLDELLAVEENKKVRFAKRTQTEVERKRTLKRRNRNKVARKARKKQMQYKK